MFKFKSFMRMHKSIGFLFFFLALFFVSIQNAKAGAPVIDGRFDDKGDYTFVGPEGNDDGEVYFDITGNTLSIAVILNTDINDTVFEEANNTAYLNSVNWANHDLQKLFKSDHLEVILDCNGIVTAWSQDFLHRTEGVMDMPGGSDGTDADANNGSGWLSTPNGPDGSGNPTFVIASESSMTYNLNEVVLANYNPAIPDSGTPPKSPGTTTPPGHPAVIEGDPLVGSEDPHEDSGTDWFWNIFYEMSVDIEGCGGTPLALGVASSHNSNSKGPEDTPLCVIEGDGPGGMIPDPECGFDDPGDPDDPDDPDTPVAPSVIIPTMGQWGMIVTTVLLGFFAIRMLRNRKDSEI